MSDDNKVVFLAFRNDKVGTDTEEVLSCGTCKNKTWKAVYREPDKFPRLQCAACGTDGGLFGWVDPDTSANGH